MSVLNLTAFDRAPLNREPFNFLVVSDAIDPDKIQVLNRDYPRIDKPANYAPKDLEYGPSFAGLLDELNSPEFEQRVASKFGVDLSGAIKTITVRRYSESSDGHIHTDHWSKIITLLVYFNPQWDQEGGRLRMLRSANDIEDYVAEVAPLGGTVLAFRRSDNSYHGYKSFDGERRMIQMSWVKPNPVAWYSQQTARFLTHSVKRMARALS
jgi:Rps23 Pro-64 3,4-dihydroxylase Tpa1-like proline 4-hydroxylase